MKPGKEMLNIINKRYTPLSAIHLVLGKYDITLKTNSDGDAVLMFAGKRDSNGQITGERFSRTIKYDREGNVIKDHWERKGKASSAMRFLTMCILTASLGCKDTLKPTATKQPDTAFFKKEYRSANAMSDFAIRVGNGSIAIDDWSNKKDPEKALGPAKSVETTVLGEGADTFTGSTVKTLKYDGLEITMFSPKQNGSTFWIKDIRLSGKRYSTVKGVKIGDPVGKRDSIYPGLTFNHDSSAKIITGANDNYIYFGIADSVVRQIHIYHELQ